MQYTGLLVQHGLTKKNVAAKWNMLEPRGYPSTPRFSVRPINCHEETTELLLIRPTEFILDIYDIPVWL